MPFIGKGVDLNGESPYLCGSLSRGSHDGARMGPVDALLFSAILEGSAERIEECWALGCDPLAVNAIGATALASACRLGRVECVKALIDRCDPRARDAYGQDALMAAAESNCVKCMELALDRCDAQERDHFGGSALMRVARAANAKAVRLLLPRSAPKQADGQGTTALIFAAAAGNWDCVKLLLPESNVDAEDALGRTALVAALHHGDENAAIAIAQAMGWGPKMSADHRAIRVAKVLERSSFLSFIEELSLADEESRILAELCSISDSESGSGDGRQSRL